MQNFSKYTLSVTSNIEIVGQNSENADYDNPRGYMYGEIFYLLAVDPMGYTRTYGGFTSETQAMNAFTFGITPDVAEWNDARPVYGSAAYQIEGTEMDYISIERMEEEYGCF